ncbi:aspartyl/asparaginyl beta-hydroxylase domain-containing protein [Asaia prunellae]|uniref:aspartyl/asparaginyl beta-hydroxylase domain-containing protein n=1 Tax=Asaia prunellae TaxID=610245 RepID=UPI000AA74FB2|nr:aspartyl/asparaginyl beta-hydroxylase domain-containing protein [Asaia prunellae]
MRIRAEDIPSLGEISRQHGRIAGDRRWRSFFFEGYGYRCEENCQRAPRTNDLLRQIPNLVTASFSVLEPGCRIPRHVGMTKGTFVYHLALKIPKNREACHITIEGENKTHTYSWNEGESLLFDDTFPHFVANDTDEDRYILLIQVQRPCRQAARRLLKIFLFCVRHSRFVQEIKTQLDMLARRPLSDQTSPAE